MKKSKEKTYRLLNELDGVPILVVRFSVSVHENVIYYMRLLVVAH